MAGTHRLRHLDVRTSDWYILITVLRHADKNYNCEVQYKTAMTNNHYDLCSATMYMSSITRPSADMPSCPGKAVVVRVESRLRWSHIRFSIPAAVPLRDFTLNVSWPWVRAGATVRLTCSWVRAGATVRLTLRKAEPFSTHRRKVVSRSHASSAYGLRTALRSSHALVPCGSWWTMGDEARMAMLEGIDVRRN